MRVHAIRSLVLLSYLWVPAFAQNAAPSLGEQAFNALKGSKNGSECRVVFRPEELSLCGEVVVPRKAEPDYRYRDREHAGRFTDHRFIIGWREQGVPGWRHMTIVFRNTEAAQRFNAAFGSWADRLPQELSP